MLTSSLLTGCGEEDCDPAAPCGQSEIFSLQIVATNPDGSPAAHLKVSGWSNLTIPLFKPSESNGRFSTTTFTFSLRESAFLRLDIFDAEDQRVRRILNNEFSFSGGWLQVIWDVRDDLDQPVPNGLYRAHVTAQDSMQNTLFEASQFGYFLSPDAATSTIGTTNDSGEFQTDNRLLFSGLGNVPVMTHRNANGDSLGTFTATDSTTLALRDDQGNAQFYHVRLTAGTNNLELTWDTSLITGAALPEPINGPAGPSDVPDPPRPVFQFLGVRPNPFN